VIQPLLRKPAAALGLALVLLALAGCGRRGPLEAPPDATAPDATQTGTQSTVQPTSPATGGASAPVGASLDSTMNQSPGTTQVTPAKPSASVYPSFVLDPLLK
jgi:predicted small lipoprotein YifL